MNQQRHHGKKCDKKSPCACGSDGVGGSFSQDAVDHERRQAPDGNHDSDDKSYFDAQRCISRRRRADDDTETCQRCDQCRSYAPKVLAHAFKDTISSFGLATIQRSMTTLKRSEDTILLAR